MSLAAIAAIGCGSGDDSRGVIALAQPIAAGCADSVTNDTDLGSWPGGRIPVQFTSGYPYESQVRDSFARWENASANIVHFVDATDADIAKITIQDCTDEGDSFGFSGCTNGCITRLCPGNIDHELGHAIGLMHQFDRHDRDHYVRMNAGSCPKTPIAEARSASEAGDFGPFDYQSTMMYGPHHPDITRWDGSSICAIVDENGLCGDGVAGPMGDPKPGDGAGVVELYHRGNGWDKFRRTFEGSDPTPYTTDLSPWSEELAVGVVIPANSSPAIETWGGDSLAIYLRGGDDNIYKKSWDTSSSTWTGYDSLGQPSDAGAVSDPAVVSWAPGRSDVVVQRGGNIYITSTPTWGTWQSLGSPSVGAASGPTITSWGPNQLDIFVRGSDDHVYHRGCSADCSGNSGTWDEWGQLGTGTFRGKPAAVARSVGTIDVFGHGMDDQVWQVQFANGWGDWFLPGIGATLKFDSACPDCGSPTAGSRGPDTIDVYVRGLDDKIWINTFSGGQWLGDALGGVVSSSAATVTRIRDDGRADIVSNMGEEVVSGTRLSGMWWKKFGG